MKNKKFEDLLPFKIEVNGKSKEIQDILFQNGCRWGVTEPDDLNYKNLDKPYLFVDEDKSISYLELKYYFDNNYKDTRLLTFDDLKEFDNKQLCIRVGKPWGNYKVIYNSPDNTHVVKIITIEPGQGISLQSHNNRSEVWNILSGSGVLDLCGIRSIVDSSTGLININKGMIHRIQCIDREPLVMVEVQYGTSCNEDDIERIEDWYNR